MDDLFRRVLDVIRNGMQITFTPDNVAAGDDFLIFSAYDKITITFHTNRVPYWIDFDGDEPMLLENCPDSFFESILLNVKNADERHGICL
jgi:hypothetical protein